MSPSAGRREEQVPSDAGPIAADPRERRPRLGGRRLAVRLEHLLNALLVVAAAALAWVAFSAGRGPSAEIGGGYERGERIGAIEGLELASREHTVLLAIASDCRFCTESLPFYRQLLAARDPATVRIVVIITEPIEQAARYLEANRVAADQLLSTAPGDLKILGTPTVLVVGSGGEVLESIVGRLSSQQERGLLDMLRDQPTAASSSSPVEGGV